MSMKINSIKMGNGSGLFWDEFGLVNVLDEINPLDEFF